MYYWGDTNTIAAGQEGHTYTLYQADGEDYYYTKIERYNSWRDEHKYPVQKTVFTFAMDAFAPSELPVLAKNAKQPVATPPVSAYRKLKGGGYAVYYDGKLYSMTQQDQRANRPFALALPPQTRILRAETNAVRILRGSELITMDATTGQQTVSAAVKLPPDSKYPNDIRTCGDGLFIFNRGKVTFYDWNGHSRNL